MGSLLFKLKASTVLSMIGTNLLFGQDTTKYMISSTRIAWSKIRTDYSSTGNKFHEGRALVWKRIGGKEYAGFIDADGNEVVPFLYNLAEDFTCGRALVKEGEKMGYIGLDGERVIPPRYDDAWPFDNGLAMVRQGSVYRYITTEGDVVKEMDAVRG